MQLGRIIGTVVATRKSDSLVGSKLLLTQPIDIDMKPTGKPLVAVDTVGAGIGEIVIYATGTASRNAAEKKTSAIDAAIVGIVDNMDVYNEFIDK
ncbi:ethanolamine utilization protein EutN [Proteiniborus ethanoligenes]|uniref:Ethanolamine utilization protein EutN n=1 Tax=Proteiniborus ethanoligenes TaxID=415015 RepID=A0A1H3NH94_9FIRM|nr:EutN/CcmL family microcompartment protein [Proteiniborus ethanoligenes]SDY88277.1 ethanolamine utilization protein EutN [Proteiniborus ethanoligenes]